MDVEEWADERLEGLLNELAASLVVWFEMSEADAWRAVDAAVARAGPPVVRRGPWRRKGT